MRRTASGVAVLVLALVAYNAFVPDLIQRALDGLAMFVGPIVALVNLTRGSDDS